MATVYIGLGTNLGNREANLELAMKLFKPEFQVQRVAPVYETEPLYKRDQPPYFNTVCCVQTDLGPEATLAKCMAIEHSMGRRRTDDKYAARIIDVDLLFYDNIVLNTANLTIPHALMYKRAFVLAPLSRIAGTYVHPVLNKTVNQLLKEIGDFSHKIMKIDQNV